jgi:Hint-domain
VCTASSLTRVHAIKIGPYEAVVLGHGITDDLATHPFLGTNFVIGNLSALDSWNDGFIVLDESPLVRDPSTGFITGFIENETAKEPTANESIFTSVSVSK